VAEQDTTRTLSRYKLIEEVGQGGMAVVYKGFDTTLNREVAVKVLHPHLAGMAESRARLQREAHAVAKLRHENILEIFDYSGPDSPESFIVTEFIHGTTLKTFLGDHPLPFPELAEMIASEVARALEHAHSLGVIHRDIKPENVMIRNDGLVKLMDFGIAQIVDKERMTVTGQLLGSPAYMAPEHVEGRPLDFRTDVFAVGILLYQLATGQLPFRGKNPHEVLKRIAECKFVAPEMVNPRIGARLARVITKALQREPGARYPDVAPMRAELIEDLADAGVEDARKELQKFFASPEPWAKAFQPRLVEALAKRGKELSEKGRTAAALELWSRALAVEPKSAELRALVDGIARRRAAGQTAMFAAVAVAIAGAITMGARWWQHRPKAADPKPPAVIRTAPPPAPVEKHDDKPPPKDPVQVVSVTHKPIHVGAPHVKAAPAEVAKKVIEIAPTPAAVRVFIDGVDKGMIVDGKYEVSEGKHEIRLDNEKCFPLPLDVDTAVKLLYPARLKWRPASLVVNTTPANADVLIEGTVANTGEMVPVKIDPLSEDGRREVSVEVSASGYKTKKVKVQLRANEKETREVTLDKLGSAE
jgi:serine/threonine-protein kinase